MAPISYRGKFSALSSRLVVSIPTVHLRDFEGGLRTHRSLDKDAPIHRAIQHAGRIMSAPVLGGLHHRYCRI